MYVGRQVGRYKEKLLSTIGSISTTFGTDLHVSHWMNSYCFGDALTSPLVSPAGQTFNLSCELSHRKVQQTFMVSNPTDFADPLVTLTCFIFCHIPLYSR